MRSGRRLLAVSAVSGIVAVFALGVLAPGAGAEGFALEKTFGPGAPGSTEFAGAGSVAVDQGKGVVYVLDGGPGFPDGRAAALFKFDLNGNPVDFGGSSAGINGNELSGDGIESTAAQSKQQVAVDPVSHTIYLTGKEGPPIGESTAILAFEPNGEPSLFTAGPGAGTNEIPIPNATSVAGVAVDADGNIYAADSGANSLYVYSRSGAPLIVNWDPGVITPTNLAIDSNGSLYITGEKIEKFIPSEYPITAATTYTHDGNLEGSGIPVSVAVDPATNEVYVSEEPPRVSVFDEEKTLLGSFGGPGEPGELGGGNYYASGLAVDSAGERVFVAHDYTSGGHSQIFVFKRVFTPAAPTIEASSASGVTADSANLHARINANTLETTYWFEYGPGDCDVSACAKVPAAGASIGSGHVPVAVTQSIAGLQSETVYHYRVVAENELGTTSGPERTFTTQGTGLGFGLSDSRVWEMVSPPDKHGGLIGLPSAGIVQAAEEGEGLAYLAVGSIEAMPEGNRASEASSVLAHRGADGWSSKDITPPHTEATAIRDAEYRLMSPDLSRALLEARDATPLSPLTTEATPYLRENSDPPLFTPLLTSAEGHADVPPGTEFDQPGLEAVGANRGLTSVAIKSPAPLAAGAEKGAVYSWAEGQLEPITELPPGEGGGVVAGSLGSGEGSVRNAVSEDGSRAFWSPGAGYLDNVISTPALYLRDTASEESVRLDVARGGSGTGQAAPAFQGASADGTVVFFTDSQHLTKGASPEGRDLYRCVIPAGPGAGGCASLTDLSSPLPKSGESAAVKDQAPALSEDGRRIYFVAEGVLDARTNQSGESALAGAPNLYLWEEGPGTRFITTLASGDAADWGAGATHKFGFVGHMSAEASPDGRYLAFMSDRSLTGYENRDASNNEPAQEVFLYEAESDRLSCVSCNPSGASPKATLSPEEFGSSRKVDPLGLWSKRWVAATLPEPRSEGFGETLYHPRAVLDDGRVFFNAFDALVPADSNGEWDVYQYEPSGVGSCAAGSGGAAIGRSGEGCVSLISSGTGEEEAAFLDSSLSGDDAFFLSTAKLSALDTDSVYDVYDARVDGVAAQPPASAECLGEACQPLAQPPNDQTPASASFQGHGNLSGQKRCRKGRRAVRRHGEVRCVRGGKKKRKAHQKHRTHHHTRRAAR
jgi:hypothetical protein